MASALAKLYAKRLGQKDSPLQDLQDIKNEEVRQEVEELLKGQTQDQPGK